jgi:host factor-I protein
MSIAETVTFALPQVRAVHTFASWIEARINDKSEEEQETDPPKMPAERQQGLQDRFLNKVRKDKVPLTIFLMNGVKLQGIVTWFDNFCVLLRRDGHSQLVYKHAISTIMPGQPVNLMEEDGGEE